MQLSTPPVGQSKWAGESAGPELAPTRPRGKHRPVVEQIACWSARHKLIALMAWLVMVGGAILAGHLYGTQSQPQYDPGQSGIAERMLDRLHVVTPPAESVLVQSRVAGPEHTFTADARMRLAARDVVAALQALPGAAADIRSPFGRNGAALVDRGGGGVLITFRV